MRSVVSVVRPALVLYALLTVLTGIAYPLVVTVVAQAAFPDRAAGSLILRDGAAVGSALIGQRFSDRGHFWSRPSATAPLPYDGANSGGSNQGPLNPALAAAVKARIDALRAADPGNEAPVPVDLVTASASGLDPHISVAGARFQAARVAEARGLALAQVQQLIDSHSEGALLGVIGEPRVNVLQLNLALDAIRR